MREILFRGKRVGGYDWAYGCYYKQTAFYGDPVEVHNIITSQEDLEYDMAMEYTSVVPETVGQFTGLTDKNGTKIFEGDILKFHKFKGEPDWLGFVRYDISMFVIEGEQPVDNGGFEVQLCSIDRKRCEIIGNIHDNPELVQMPLEVE